MGRDKMGQRKWQEKKRGTEMGEEVREGKGRKGKEMGRKGREGSTKTHHTWKGDITGPLQSCISKNFRSLRILLLLGALKIWGKIHTEVRG